MPIKGSHHGCSAKEDTAKVHRGLSIKQNVNESSYFKPNPGLGATNSKLRGMQYYEDCKSQRIEAVGAFGTAKEVTH